MLQFDLATRCLSGDPVITCYINSPANFPTDCPKPRWVAAMRITPAIRQMTIIIDPALHSPTDTARLLCRFPRDPDLMEHLAHMVNGDVIHPTCSRLWRIYELSRCRQVHISIDENP